jgi:flagellar export protein FliJ
MSSRQQRIGRLVDQRERGVDAARTALGSAVRAVRAAEAVRDDAEAAWCNRANELAREGSPTVGSLVDARAHLETLRRRAEAAAAKLAIARRGADAAREACVRADRELKKMEVWQDHLVEAERVELERKERLRTDEAAARSFVRVRA